MKTEFTAEDFDRTRGWGPNDGVLSPEQAASNANARLTELLPELKRQWLAEARTVWLEELKEDAPRVVFTERGEFPTIYYNDKAAESIEGNWPISARLFDIQPLPVSARKDETREGE